MVRTAYSRLDMSDQTQLELLQSTKEVLNVTWDELAERAGINPRALKTYRMPLTSKDYRPMPFLARSAIQRLLNESRKNQCLKF
jgi:predicted PP-loop superfamily ATPase